MGFEPKKSKTWQQHEQLWISNWKDAGKRADKTEAKGSSYVNILICTYTIFQTVTFILIFSCKIFIYALKTFYKGKNKSLFWQKALKLILAVLR